MAGYLRLYRSIKDNWVYKDPEHLKMWMEILLNARYAKSAKQDTYQNILYTINYGEFIFGRPEWSKRLGIGEQRIRTFFKKLCESGMIEVVQKYPKFTIYKVINYEKFNQQDNQQNDLDTSGLQDIANQQTNQQPTSIQPASNQQPTTKEEGNNVKNDKKVKEKHIVDFSSQIETYTNDPILIQALKDFVSFRKDIKKPFSSEMQFTTWLKSLDKFGNDRVAVLEQSIANGWQGIFELKSNPNKNLKGDVKNGVMHGGEYIDFDTFFSKKDGK